MDPVIVVLSYGSLSSIDITKYIISLATDEDAPQEIQTINAGTKTFQLYTWNLKTKYYTNTISILPLVGDDDVKNVPEELLKLTEALIIFMDPKDRKFLETLPLLEHDIKDYENIGLRIILTDGSLDESNITYENLKKSTSIFFDIIEHNIGHNEKTCNENVISNDDNENDFNDNNTLLDALQNNLWSNVEMPANAGKGNGLINECNSVEEQLESFETLFKNIQNFKKLSSTLTREEVLSRAEIFAETFCELINEDFD